MRRTVLTLICGISVLGSARASPAIETYGRLPGVEFVKLSPSGDKYAFVAVIGESRKLAVLGYDNKPLFATGVGSAKIRGMSWAGDNHLLITTSSTFSAPLDFVQSYELSSVINLDVRKRQVSIIFGKSQGIAHTVRGEFGTAQVDGHLYGYFGGITYERDGALEYFFHHGYPDLYQVDLDTDKTTLVARGSELDHQWVIAPDGSVLAYSRYNEVDGMWRLFSDRFRGKQMMEKASPLDDIELMGLGRSAGTVTVLDESGDRDIVSEFSLSDGKGEELFKALSLTDYVRDPDTHQLLGAMTRGESQAVFFDPKLQSRFNGTRKAFPGLRVELNSFSRNMDRLIVKTDGGDDSGTFWMVDIASGKADPIGYEYPGVHSADVGVTKLVKYTATDGLSIDAVLTLPPGRKAENLPLVILPHGGPIDVSDEVGFDWWAQAFASRGYAVLQPNYRGSAGRGREFRQAGFGQWGRKMQTDLSDGLAALAKEGIIDSKRACIMGGSYGGYAALAGVTLQQGLYRCAVAVAGPADLQAFFAWQIQRHGYRSDATRYWRAVIGADKEGDTLMRTLSPAHLAHLADAPILLIHGKDDTVVPIGQSETMATALKRAHKPFEYLEMKGEDHWLSREDTRVTMLKAAVDFVEKYNPPDR